MWPGCLVVAADSFPTGGVFIYAMMAAGGDMGAALGPQLIGVVTDAVIKFEGTAALCGALSLNPEQLGMKLGILAAALFPLAAIPVYNRIRKLRK